MCGKSLTIIVLISFRIFTCVLLGHKTGGSCPSEWRGIVVSSRHETSACPRGMLVISQDYPTFLVISQWGCQWIQYPREAMQACSFKILLVWKSDSTCDFEGEPLWAAWSIGQAITCNNQLRHCQWFALIFPTFSWEWKARKRHLPASSAAAIQLRRSRSQSSHQHTHLVMWNCRM